MRLSQIELAERAQVRIATIKRVEMGEAVTLSTLIGILLGLLFNRFCNQSQVSLLKSGTEPLIRVMVLVEDKNQVTEFVHC